MNRVPMIFLTVILSLLGGAGCSTMSGDLRSDLNDNLYPATPTMGGRWVEGGYLSEDMEGDAMPSIYGERNQGRSLASAQNSYDPGYGGKSWAQNQTPPLKTDGPLPPPNVRNQAQAGNNAYKNGVRATRADFQDDANEGSLWASDGQTNYYFTKNKVRGVGDILTITTEAQLMKDVSYELARTLTPEERDVELELAQARLQAKADGLPDPDAPAGADSVGSAAASPARAPAGADKKESDPKADVRKATLQDIDVSRSMEFKAGDPIMAEIMERYPNGNYKVRGSKRINYKQGARFVTVTAIVKASDIDDNETVPSGKLYEYRLEANR